MKFKMSIMFLITIILITLFGGTGIANTKSYEWTFSTIGPENSFRHTAIMCFKENVERKTNGLVKINVFPDGILGSAKETFEALQLGGIDFQLAAASAVGTVVSQAQVLAAPCIVNNREEAYAVLEGPIGNKICALLEEKGIKVLAFADLSFVQVTNNVRPINNPDDFKGLMMRSPSALQYIETFKTLGASVSTMPLGEVYIALSQGIMDGQFNPLDAIRAKSFYEVQDYLAIMNLFFYNTYFCMSKNLWDDLDPELQKIVKEAALEGTKAGREFSEKAYNKNIDFLKSKFKEITYPEMDPFREKVQPVYAELDKVWGGIIEETREFLKQYRMNN